MSATNTTHSVDLGAITSSLDRDGYAIIPGVLSSADTERVVDRLWAASGESQRRGNLAHIEGLDPNAANVRVFDLVDLDPLFGELLEHPLADAILSGFLGPDYIVSNFTANIARPGSGSMSVHSDQSIVAPEPGSSRGPSTSSGVSVTYALTTAPLGSCPGAIGGPRGVPGPRTWRPF